MGNLGNSMFQLAALYGMSKKYKMRLAMPEWEYQHYFTHQVELTKIGDFKDDIGEPSYEFSGWKFWDDKLGGEGRVSLSGWFQSPRYWEDYESEVKSILFNFNPDWKYLLLDGYKELFSKPVILIGFRVGEDYVSNGNYEILDPRYQVSALYENFPDWETKYNILVCADDYQYAKLQMNCHPNIYFGTGLSDIEQMFLGSMCDHFIIPNSTFSWWQAYLGEKAWSKVIRPSKYFKKYLAEISTTDDLWPLNWITHNYRGHQLDLTDVMFTIPIKHDHDDRVENFKLIHKWIHHNFATNVTVGEQGSREFGKHVPRDNYMIFPDGHFHRTRMLNEMAKGFKDPIIVNFDCDNICPIMQMMVGVGAVRRGEADMVYPYDGRVARVDREKWYDRLLETKGDVGIFGITIFKGTRAIDPLSVGHIIIWNKEKFFEGGGENENFISYGPEDVERYERFDKLDYRIHRVKGIVYHIDHWCGPDSSGRNPLFARNYEELDKIRDMDKQQLREYVNEWKWIETKKAPQ